METHCCQGVAGPADVINPATLATLRTLPVTVEKSGGLVAVWGLPPSLLMAILDLLRPGSPCYAVSRPFRCKLKTAVVPVAGITRWRAARVGGIIAGGNISGHWRYLGAAAASPHPGPGPPRGRWHPAAISTVQTLSWAPGLAKLAARAGAIAALRGSFGIRAA